MPVDENMANAIPTWTRPVSPGGNWDEVGHTGFGQGACYPWRLPRDGRQRNPQAERTGSYLSASSAYAYQQQNRVEFIGTEER